MHQVNESLHPKTKDVDFRTSGFVKKSPKFRCVRASQKQRFQKQTEAVLPVFVSSYDILQTFACALKIQRKYQRELYISSRST